MNNEAFIVKKIPTLFCFKELLTKHMAVLLPGIFLRPGLESIKEAFTDLSKQPSFCTLLLGHGWVANLFFSFFFF